VDARAQQKITFSLIKSRGEQVFFSAENVVGAHHPWCDACGRWKISLIFYVLDYVSFFDDAHDENGGEKSAFDGLSFLF
jgi:hypothetical protein